MSKRSESIRRDARLKRRFNAAQERENEGFEKAMLEKYGPDWKQALPYSKAFLLNPKCPFIPPKGQFDNWE